MSKKEAATLIVATLQEKLANTPADDGLPYYFDRERNAPAAIDNLEGPLTRAAVSRFKSERLGWRARPYVGPLTWAELAELRPPRPAAKDGTDAPWLDYGLRFVGEREIKGARHNPLIVEWGRDAGIDWWHNDEDAWCAVAVNGWLVATGYPSTGSALARSFTDYGRPIPSPVRGAIVVFPRGKVAWQGHVGIIETVNDDGTIDILNGNVGDAVRISTRRVDTILPHGLRWPEKEPGT